MNARQRPLLVGVAVVAVLLLGVIAFVPLGPRGQATPPPASPGASTLVVGGSPLMGKPAPEFSLADLDGKPVALADYRGRPVIVNFWASWCVPCRSEFPLFVEARAAAASTGLEILGITYKDSAASAKRFAADQGALWPLLADPDETAWRAYGGFGVPTTFFIDAAGVVRAVSYGPLTAEGFADQVAQILPPGASPLTIPVS